MIKLNKKRKRELAFSCGITITGEKRLKTYWGQNSKLTRKSETYDGMLELA